MTETRWGLVGPGTIGKELCHQLAQGGADRFGLKATPDSILGSRGQYDYDPSTGDVQSISSSQLSMGEYCEIFDGRIAPDVVFLAIPSDAEGNIALRYMLPPLTAGKVVVTAEKAALANHYASLREHSDNFARLRHNASVGGGTGIIDSLREHCVDPGSVNELHLSLNGTLSFIWGKIDHRRSLGMSLSDAVKDSQRLGYAEPGNDDAYAIIHAEAEQDVPKKVANLFNRLELTDRLLFWKDLDFSLEDDAIALAVAEAAHRRLLVSIYPPGQSIDRGGDVLNMRTATVDGWNIVMGFHNIGANPLHYLPLTQAGASNGYSIGLGHGNEYGTHSYVGSGAGPGPTAHRMLKDVLQARREGVV